VYRRWYIMDKVNAEDVINILAKKIADLEVQIAVLTAQKNDRELLSKNIGRLEQWQENQK